MKNLLEKLEQLGATKDELISTMFKLLAAIRDESSEVRIQLKAKPQRLNVQTSISDPFCICPECHAVVKELTHTMVAVSENGNVLSPVRAVKKLMCEKCLEKNSVNHEN